MKSSPRPPDSPTRRRLLVAGAAAMVAGPALGALAGCSDDGKGTDVSAKDRTERRYREGRFGVGALTRPASAEADLPVVVLVHGGFWRAGFERDLMEPLAEAVVARGWAAWNLDYRPVREGGGWPTTFTDVAEGVDHLKTLAEDDPLDLDRVVVMGHSAGGTLALWTAARAKLVAGAPGADPTVRPVGAVSQAGINNLIAGVLEGLGGGAITDLMGGSPREREADYLIASPVESLPLDVPQLLVHGAGDGIVPPRQSTAYAAKAEVTGDAARAVVLDGDHFTVIDPDHPLGEAALDWVAERVA